MVRDQDEAVKYLGVHLDRRLSWKHHINNKLTLAYSRLAKLYPLLNKKSSLKLQNCMLLYTSLLRPLLLYACPVREGAALSEIEHIQSFQNEVLRISLNSPWFVRNGQLHRETGIDTIKQFIHSQAKKFYNNLENVPEPSITLSERSPHFPPESRADFQWISYYNQNCEDINIERIPNLSAEQSDGITVFRISPMESLMLHRCRTGAISLQRWWQSPLAAISESDWFLCRAGISRQMTSCTVVSWREQMNDANAILQKRDNIQAHWMNSKLHSMRKLLLSKEIEVNKSVLFSETHSCDLHEDFRRQDVEK
ncbi:hypothetical protein ANN_20144 [Periplaneta americana]|uniref:Uncharacterized protein n=1 Tax=Periplaneta americana TaxID=6978 RepID=A0ABQ8SC12_PERAM|nr:hypothetical protein ANN_20144 [Periplaneta americana]